MAALSHALRRLFAGALAGLLSCLYLSLFISLLFSAAAPAFQHDALAFGLVASLGGSLTILVPERIKGLLWQAQSITVMVLLTPATQIGEALQGSSQASAFATMAALLSLTALLSGLAMALFGRLRLGRLGVAVPYPVLGGFLAATGMLLVLRGLSPGDGLPAVLATAADWAPPLLCALGAFALAQKGHQTIGLLAFGALCVAISGVLPGEPGPLAAPAPEIADHRLPLLAGVIDWGLVWQLAPSILLAAGLSVLSVLLNLTALNRQDADGLDPDPFLRWCLPENLWNAAFSSIVAFPSYALTQLAWQIAPTRSRLAPLGMVLVVAGFLAVGPGRILDMPQVLFQFLMNYLGLGLLHAWLWSAPRRMPRPDAALLFAILGVTLTYDFLTGIAVGTVAAALRFSFAYARLPVRRARFDAALRRSSVERSEARQLRLSGAEQEAVVVQLTGFLFFGSAPALDSVLDEALGCGAARVILDFQAVRGVDVSAVTGVRQFLQRAAGRGIEVYLAGMNREVEADLSRSIGTTAIVVERLDDALRLVEEAILSAAPQDDEQDELRQTLAQIEAEFPDPILSRRALSAGEVLFRIGAPPDALYVLEQGTLVAEINRSGVAAFRVAEFRPGAVVGEMGMVSGARRSASVRALEPCTLLELDARAMDRLKRDRPDLALAVTERIATTLARRLSQSTRLLHIYERPPQ
ncbi:cyclic nucleotide-binding domain-containing protein [Salipiger pacificus]|nr:cyclic nucleotide-binding domain-containing protein [Alloyangia pacifica]MCA0945037.1 cyclic nucleotide-binding domain-containing protein [Alloyangia pacifica]